MSAQAIEGDVKDLADAIKKDDEKAGFDAICRLICRALTDLNRIADALEQGGRK
jgi:hypothetical protein